MFKLNLTLTNAVCVVIFNGIILGSEVVYPDQSTNEFEILIQLTTKMWPLVHVVLYSMGSDSNVLVMARTTITPTRPDHEHVSTAKKRRERCWSFLCFIGCHRSTY